MRTKVCPECRDGKHQNCDGIGGFDDFDDDVVPCACDADEPHPNQIPGLFE